MKVSRKIKVGKVAVGLDELVALRGRTGSRTREALK